MAKMKVYDLAKELGVKSAEILTVLKSKGIEVKSHMSVLEDFNLVFKMPIVKSLKDYDL